MILQLSSQPIKYQISNQTIKIGLFERIIKTSFQSKAKIRAEEKYPVQQLKHEPLAFQLSNF